MTDPVLPQSLHARGQFFYAALSVMLLNNPNGPVPELLYFMNPDQVLTFISMFEGTTIRVPTLKEFGEDLQIALAAYYRFNQGLTPQATQDRLRLTDAKWKALAKRLDRWCEAMRDEVQMDPQAVLS